MLTSWDPIFILNLPGSGAAAAAAPAAAFLGAAAPCFLIPGLLAAVDLVATGFAAGLAAGLAAVFLGGIVNECSLC